MTSESNQYLLYYLLYIMSFIEIYGIDVFYAIFFTIFQEIEITSSCELESVQKMAAKYEWRKKTIHNVYESLTGCRIFDVRICSYLQ